MIKAIISNGLILPSDPLPDDWQEGTVVTVERFPDSAIPAKDGACTDVWMDEVESIARQGDPQDDERLDVAVQEIHRREKEHEPETKQGNPPLTRQENG